MSIEDLPDTAYLTAIARAEATARPDSGLRDPYAERFAKLCPSSIKGITRNTAGLSVLLARTLLIDRMLGEALNGSGAAVCVNLGAGFDARPYRLDWPSHCRVVEIDFPAVLNVKDRLLPPRGANVPVERLRCDLLNVEALTALLKPRTDGQAIVFLAEGLLPYLPDLQLAKLASALARLGLSATWICDIVSVESARLLRATSRSAHVNLELYSMSGVSTLEKEGWYCERLAPLPTAHTITTRARPRSLPATTSRVPDGVLLLRLGERRQHHGIGNHQLTTTHQHPEANAAPRVVRPEEQPGTATRFA